MALEVDFLDSMAHEGTVANERLKWAGMNNFGAPPAGAFASGGYTDVATQNFAARGTFEFSGYWYTAGVPASEGDFLILNDTFGQQVRFRVAPDGTLLVRAPAAAGNTILAQSVANAIQFGLIWHHVRVRFVCSATIGEVYVWVNGALKVNGVPNIVTKYSTTATVTQLQTSGGATGGLWSHMAFGNDFTGQPRTGCVFASGAGATTGWTPTAAANWENINETTPNVADYNSAATAGLVDTYKFANAIPAGAIILAVAVTALVKKTEAGVCEVAMVVSPPGAADTIGVTQQVPATDAYLQDIWELNPVTGLAWTPAQLNDADFEAGIKAITVTA